MAQKITQVDAFSDRPFGGNPAGVCILDRPREEAWLRAVAREMNLSETAFLVKASVPASDPGWLGSPPPGVDYRLRWFTPAAEVDLCGHATLSAAHVLWEEGRVRQGEPICFFSRSGRLTAVREAPWITLDFPAQPPVPVPDPPRGMLDALRLADQGAKAVYVGFGGSDYLVEIEAADPVEAVRSLTPDFGALGRVEARGVIVTARAGGGRSSCGPASWDFVSRFFAPAVGISEDPVTGSSHCSLGPYWGRLLGKDSLVGFQVSARGGLVKVGLVGDRAKIGGQAVTVLRGEILEA